MGHTISEVRALSFALILLLLAGCGGGGGNDNAEGSPTPRVTPTPTAAPPRAWAVGAGTGESVIARSRDGGAMWSLVHRTPQRLAGIEFVDRNVGWAVGAGEILHTEDGGDVWTSQRSNVPDPAILGQLLAVTFVTPSQGTIVGARPGGLPPAAPTGAALILRTTDAGVNWQPAPIDTRGNAALSQSALAFVCFTGAGTGLSCGEGLAGAACVLSIDGGATWLAVSDRIVGRNGTCVGDADLWVLRGGGLLSHSNDHGTTWVDRSASVPSADTGELLGITFTDPLTGWISGTDPRGHPLILHTTDGGATWGRQIAPDIQAGLTAVAFVDVEGIAIGSSTSSSTTRGALALRTTSSGALWQLGTLPSEVELFDTFDSVSIVP